MTENEIIQEVKKGVKNLDMYKIHNAKWEDFKLFHYYRDLILDNYFKHSIKLQKIYFELFDKFEILDEKLDSLLKDILSEDEQTRITASIALEKAPRMTVNMVDKIWLRDPRTHDILAKALDDENTIVLSNIIKCFNNIYFREGNYRLENITIYNKILSKYENADNDLKIVIVKTSFNFLYAKEYFHPEGSEKIAKKIFDENWERVCEVLDFKPKKNLYTWLGWSIGWAGEKQLIPLAYKDIIKEKIWHDFQTARGKFVKWKCLLCYLQICFDDVDELKRIRENYTNEQLGPNCARFVNGKLE